MIYFLSLSLILILSSIWIVLKRPTRRKYSMLFFGIVSFTAMLVLSGARGLKIGTDTEMYVRYFNSVEGLGDLSSYADRFETVYRIFNCLIAQIFGDAHALLFLSTLVTLTLFYILFYKKSKVPWYSILMFLFLMFYYNSMCLLRQYIAMAVTSIALIYLGDKKYISFIVIALIAGNIHSSAFIILIMLPLSMVKITRKRRVPVIVAAIAISLSMDKIISILIRLMPRYATYLGSGYYLENQLGTFLKSCVWTLMFFVVDYAYFKYSVNEDEAQESPLWNRIEYYCGLLGFSITLASMHGAILERMSYYFAVIYCVSVANALNKFKRRRSKYRVAFAIMCGSIVYNLVILGLRPYWSGVIPYIFWE